MNNIKLFLIVLGVVLGVYGVYLLAIPNEIEQKIEAGNKAYQIAVVAKTIDERKESFNDALKYYSELEKMASPIYGNGRLYHNIGNIYYELETYPWALLYYYRAQKLDLFNKELELNIQRSRDLLKLPKTNHYSVFKQLFFFHHYLPLPKRLQLFFIFGCIAFALGSGALWFKQQWFVRGAVLAGVLSGVFLISGLHTRYLEPLEGVLIEATMLTRSIDNPNDWVTKTPTLPGTRVSILDVLDEGRWLKVMAPDGALGYVPANRIRVI